ncbi:Nuclear nucleic acid-binding protein C1D [Varanus komodoensis]|nr:Nuclear nucleic acid-binding protein C1D [Varanus komodoensis]
MQAALAEQRKQGGRSRSTAEQPSAPSPALARQELCPAQPAPAPLRRNCQWRPAPAPRHATFVSTPQSIMSEMDLVREEYPTEIHDYLLAFEKSVASVDEMLKTMMSVSRSELLQKLASEKLHRHVGYLNGSLPEPGSDNTVARSDWLDLDPLEQAKLDLVSVYTLNSMFWVYLATQGINPKEHPVKQELRAELYASQLFSYGMEKCYMSNNYL